MTGARGAGQGNMSLVARDVLPTSPRAPSASSKWSQGRPQWLGAQEGARAAKWRPRPRPPQIATEGPATPPSSPTSARAAPPEAEPSAG